MKKILMIVLLSMSFLQTACSDAKEQSMQTILALNEPPVGVVFELATGDDNGLEWAIPLVRSYATQLRERFPNIKLAVVSHGLEQFQLVRNEQKEVSKSHTQVASLIKDKNIEVHVCGNFAGMLGVERDEFIDVVKVAKRAPLQVESFIDAGYKLVLISVPE